MEPVLAKAFAGFKVVAVSAHQIGFSAFLAIGVCWRFRGRKYAIEQDTNKCRLPLRIPAKLNSHSGQREHPDP